VLLANKVNDFNPERRNKDIACFIKLLLCGCHIHCYAYLLNSLFEVSIFIDILDSSIHYAFCHRSFQDSFFIPSPRS
jgi:hypothetical protein